VIRGGSDCHIQDLANNAIYLLNVGRSKNSYTSLGRSLTLVNSFFLPRA